MKTDKTLNYMNSKEDEKQINMRYKEELKDIYASLIEKGYNPVNQMVGYILSGDPTYITNHKEARSKITKLERDKLLECMIKEYLELDN